jgi:hypothetical protein
VLVVDLHALQSVDVLHFVGDVARERFHAEQPEKKKEIKNKKKKG